MFVSASHHLQPSTHHLPPTTHHQVADDAPVDKTRGQKKVHFVRHGEGYHNVAQREWRQASKPGEPYTIDTDPEFKFIDALLTPAGVEQVRLTYYLQISSVLPF